MGREGGVVRLSYHNIRAGDKGIQCWFDLLKRRNNRLSTKETNREEKDIRDPTPCDITRSAVKKVRKKIMG